MKTQRMLLNMAVLIGLLIAASALPTMAAAKVDLSIAGVADANEMTKPGKVLIKNGDMAQITISVTEAGKVKLDCTRTRTGTGQLAVYKADRTTTVTLPATYDLAAGASVTLYVKGTAASSQMGDLTLTADYKNGTATDKALVTVLWVKITAECRSTKSLANDNAGRNTYSQLLLPATFDLGPHMYWDRMGWGCEFKGTVAPSDFTQTISLGRDYECMDYDGPAGKRVHYSATFPAKIVPPGKDQGPSACRDDDPQSAASTGEIYDFDNPGTAIKEPDAANTIRRTRTNFKAFAVYNGKQCSKYFKWYTKQSWKKTGVSDRGTATGSTNTTLKHAGKTWAGDTWKNGTIYIYAGTGAGAYRLISGNTADTITVGRAWRTNPDNTSKYLLNALNSWTQVNDVANDNDTGSTGSGTTKLTWNL